MSQKKDSFLLESLCNSLTAEELIRPVFSPFLHLSKSNVLVFQKRAVLLGSLTSLLFPLAVLSLALCILPVFLIPQSWMQEFGRRASAWAEDWRLITSSGQRTRIPVGLSSSPPFSGSPGKSHLQVARDICKATLFAPFSHLLLLLLFLSSFWNL